MRRLRMRRGVVSRRRSGNEGQGGNADEDLYDGTSEGEVVQDRESSSRWEEETETDEPRVGTGRSGARVNHLEMEWMRRQETRAPGL